MSRRNVLAKNGGSAAIAVSHLFSNSRKREKYLGRRGELVADMCECGADVDGVTEVTAKLYVHDGITTGGVPVSAVPCPIDMCAILANEPDLGLLDT